MGTSLPLQGFLQDDAVGHGTVGFVECVGLVLDAEHCQVFLAGVFQCPFAIGGDPDDRSFADREDLSVYLIGTLAAQDDVKLLMCFVCVQETAVLTGKQCLETQLAACGSNRLTGKNFTLDLEIRTQNEFVLDDLRDVPYVYSFEIFTFFNGFDRFHYFDFQQIAFYGNTGTICPRVTAVCVWP